MKYGSAVLAAALLLPGAASAAPPTVVSPPLEPQLSPGESAEDRMTAWEACRQKARREEIFLDRTRRQLHQTVCGAALWFDGLFGERDPGIARESYGHVEVSHSYSEFYGNDTRVRFHARVQLPALEERLSLFVGRDDEEDFVRDRTEGQALRSQQRPANDRDEFLAGLGFTAITTERFRSDFRIGVRNVRLPKVFVQNRFSYIPYSDHRHRVFLRATPFWSNREGAGFTASADIDRVLRENFVLRWGSIGTITERTTEGVDWRSAVILYQNLRGASVSHALAYELFVRGAAEAAEPLTEYGLRLIYRWPMFGERLIGELVPGYSWPRTDPAAERDGAAAISLGFELPFGQQPR